ncbi:hypothetical protein V496_00298 [Pseudogymnoascus sp. VKM F-4515 (FW-2607)]|nr:hypothetical protein V496_00298 [Pseudogymnoascus sp. VKM F-4515 (FW-2607)]KFY95050.1 hypothetical protein V498_03563 [Pseudogymnoascus sp. VKM F-4517 (FW-2822)]
MATSKPELPATEPRYDPTRPLADVKCLYNNVIPNAPGKSIISYLVSQPPNGSTPPHTHAGAFVSAYIISGYMLNGMNEEPMQLLGPGESFRENPGCHHRLSENASATEPASFIATLVVDTETVNKLGVEGLTVIDPEYLELIAQAQKKA